MASTEGSSAIAEFLKPLRVDTDLAVRLQRELRSTFVRLAAESLNQFLATPISESMLRSAGSRGKGRYFAIDIGGTNLRVGLVELDERLTTGHAPATGSTASLRRIQLHERSWPIGEYLKNENAESLFGWIGERIATVIRETPDCESLVDKDGCIPMGVTFSFPMVQHSLSEATLMTMGKGFAITSNLDLSRHLITGYEKARDSSLPRIRIVAIANDAVATLVSFFYQIEGGPRRKAAMGLICGTGSNATLPIRLGNLHPQKRPASVSVIPGQSAAVEEDERIAVNTEWSINGSAPPLRKLHIITEWDRQLDQAGEAPGFQPLEYMTAGRYLGELGRIILLDYLHRERGVAAESLPAALRTRFGLTTTFLSNFRPQKENSLLGQLNKAFPTGGSKGNGSDAASFAWTADVANALYEIARAIERRAAAIIAAATVGLLACAGEIAYPDVDEGIGAGNKLGTAAHVNGEVPPSELAVGYTGGCISHFQEYLRDCQQFLDDILAAEFAGRPSVRIVLYPCHDGGILGAGILVPTALASKQA